MHSSYFGMPVINLEKAAPFICNQLRQALPGLLGIYSFGSQTQQNAGPESDLDLAVLVSGYIDKVTLWNLGNKLANELNIDLDLLDLRAASTVMQYQIITGGECLWSASIETDEFELYVLSEKYDLDLWRKPLIDQIKEEGRIYDR